MRGKGTEAEAKEEKLAVANPKLATLIYHSFNIAFVLVVILYIVHVVVYYNSSEVWWQAFLAAAIVSPLFIAPLYYMPMLRDFFVKEYDMGSHDNHGSFLGSKLLASEKA